MALALVKPWRTQPDRVAGVDWENPLSRGLVWQGTPVDEGLPFGNRAVITGNFPASVGFAGRAWRGAYQASNNYVRVNRTAILGYTAQVTFEALIFVRSFQTNIFPYISGIIGQYQLVGGSSKYGPSLRFNNNATQANAGVPVFIITQSGGVERQAAGSALTAGRFYHLLGTYNGSTVVLYVNGKQVASTSATGAFDNDTLNFISIGSDYADDAATNRSLNGDIFLARIYNVGKTAAEAAALAANPYQLFTGVETLSVPTYYPILSNLQATRGNTSAALRTNINY